MDAINGGLKMVTLLEPEQQNLIIEQAISRYDMMARELKSIPEEERNSSVTSTLETFKEMQELVENLRNGGLVSTMEANLFVEDINEK